MTRKNTNETLKNDVKRLLGRRIQMLRKNRNLTQEALAEIIGIEPQNVSMIEIGKNYPSPDTLAKIAQALDLEIYELFMFKKHKTLKEIREYVIDKVERSELVARTLFKFCKMSDLP